MVQPSAEFVPHPFVKGGHMQTIIAHLASREKHQPASIKVTIDYRDGDRSFAYVNEPRFAGPKVPSLLLFHGLGGCSESTYNLRLAKKLVPLGIRVIRVNHRGCGPGGAPLAKKIYHSGSHADMLTAIETVKSIWPQSPLHLIGFSLSANMLLMLLASYGKVEALVEKALAICPPIDLKRSARALAARRNLIYDRFYTRLLLNHAKQRSATAPALAPDLPRRINLAEFDRLYTVKHGGFQSRDQYYDICSSKSVIEKIRVPCQILASRDDPIIPVASFSDVKLGQTTLEIAQSGGHMGFLSGVATRFRDWYWQDEKIAAWLLGANNPSSP